MHRFIVSPVDSRTCPSDDWEYDDARAQCYTFPSSDDEPVDIGQARETCRSLDAHLPRIETEDDEAFITSTNFFAEHIKNKAAFWLDIDRIVQGNSIEHVW